MHLFMLSLSLVNSPALSVQHPFSFRILLKPVLGSSPVAKTDVSISLSFVPFRLQATSLQALGGEFLAKVTCHTAQYLPVMLHVYQILL